MDFTRVVNQRIAELAVRPSELARATGYSIQYICDLLAGRRRWNETTINKVSRALNIEISFTCTGGEGRDSW